jgi:2-keto-4-pentenoate hydratase/2-oxohepta-3-ene-1,7-dioic acid hydratase in catechol pathway
MKAVRYAADAGARLGRLEDGRVVDAGPAPDEGFVPTDAAWDAIAAAEGTGVLVKDVRLLHPTHPAKIIAIGLNYRDHAEESELVIPREETRPDYEGEVAAVLGRTVYRASPEEARAAVGGLSCFHDVSGRRAQLETPLRQFTLGKSFDTFAPMGPCVAHADGADLEAIGIRTSVNGVTMQDSNTRNLIFSIVELIVYCSAGMTLEAGTIIATGTPGGVGDSRTPPRYLREGDVVEITVDGVGTLRNPIALEA